MTEIAAYVALVGRSPELVMVAKATVVLALALLAVHLATGTRAACRHAVLVAAFAVLLLLPLAARVMPPTTFEVAAASTPPSARARAPLPPPALTNTTGLGSAAMPVFSAPLMMVAPTAPSIVPSAASALRAAWAIGLLLSLVPVVLTLWRLRSIQRTGIVWAPGEALVRDLSATAGRRRDVTVLVHEGVEAPMTLGLLRPVIVLPWDAVEWSHADVRRAAIHELEHIARADWLVHVLVRCICAAYWFHPLAWIAWNRLRLEAERACDDAVLRREEGDAYAHQLVQLAARMSAVHVHPLVSMTGTGSLAIRVRAILDRRCKRGRAGVFWTTGVTGFAALMLAIVAPLGVTTSSRAAEPTVLASINRSGEMSAQPVAAPIVVGSHTSMETLHAGTATPQAEAAPAARFESVQIYRSFPSRQPPLSDGVAQEPQEPKPRFEVTSVRKRLDGAPNSVTFSPTQGDLFVRSNTSVAALIIYAFELEPYQLIGGPDWIRRERFDVAARSEQPEGAARLRLMVQSLLEERFRLITHTEPREFDVYKLIMNSPDGKLGPYVQSAEECKTSAPEPWKQRPQDAVISVGCGAMSTLARAATSRLGVPVVDRTGLTGVWRYWLYYSRQGLQLGRPSSSGPTSDGPDGLPSFAVALQQQLGLSLERGREPLEVVVVDSIEPPTEN